MNNHLGEQQLGPRASFAPNGLNVPFLALFGQVETAYAQQEVMILTCIGGVPRGLEQRALPLQTRALQPNELRDPARLALPKAPPSTEKIVGSSPPVG